MEGMIGEIRMFGGNFAPRSWAFCDGQLLPINQNNALFSILGTTYGGDGRTTFALPDLRGRVSIHQGNGPGLSSHGLGSDGGSETNTLTDAQLPSHTHGAKTRIPVALGDYDSDDESDRRDAGFIKGTLDEGRKGQGVRTKLSAAGGGQPINNMQPYLSVNYIICTEGVYPSRS